MLFRDFEDAEYWVDYESDMPSEDASYIELGSYGCLVHYDRGENVLGEIQNVFPNFTKEKYQTLLREDKVLHDGQVVQYVY